MTWLLALISGKWRTYLAIAGISLVIVVGAYFKGYMAGVHSNDAKALEKAREGQVKIIKDTQIITKVIRDAKDPCASTAVPKPILDSLR